MTENPLNKEQLSYFIKELTRGEVDKKIARYMKDFFLDKEKTLKREIKERETELKEVQRFLEMYERAFETGEYWRDNSDTKPIDNENSEDENYRSKDYWRKLSLKVLKKNEKFIRSTVIMDSSPIKDKGIRRQCMSMLSIVLSEMYEKEIVTRIKVKGEKGYYYAMPGTPPIIIK